MREGARTCTPRISDLIAPSEAGLISLDEAQACAACCCLSTASSLQMLCCCPSPAAHVGRVGIAVATASTIRAPECGNGKRGLRLPVISSTSPERRHGGCGSGFLVSAAASGAFLGWRLWSHTCAFSPAEVSPSLAHSRLLSAITRLRGCLGGAACGESAVGHTAL